MRISFKNNIVRIVLFFTLCFSLKSQDEILSKIFNKVTGFEDNNISPVALIVTSNAVIGFGKYPWHKNIPTTLFWVGQKGGILNSKSKISSAWDKNWESSYGGYDTPDTHLRSNFVPIAFTPQQNPFYIQLPYNDVTNSQTKSEASKIIPWFKDTFENSGQSVLKGRWVAIYYAGRTCFAQWEDVGPLSDNQGQYVFGEAPQTTTQKYNRFVGIGVSPAVRDFLNIEKNVNCAWKFVDSASVPDGPWKNYGDNNTFALLKKGLNLLQCDRNNTIVRTASPATNIEVERAILVTNDPWRLNGNIQNNSSNVIAETNSSDSIPTIHYFVTGISTNDTLNAHTGPGSSYPVSFTIPFDAIGITCCEMPVMNGETEWVKVEYLGVTGYVVTSYIQPQ